MFSPQSWQLKLLLVSVFAIAMGFMESAVVIYLRYSYYPDGFDFPLVSMPAREAITEVIRELATLIMLLILGWLAGTSRSRKLAYFLYAFGIWDLAYYVFLKLILDWPDNLLSWDILFLIPSLWTGPVLCPVILSLTMISLALYIIVNESKGQEVHLRNKVLVFLGGGSLLVILSFLWDYSSYLLNSFSVKELFSAAYQTEVQLALSGYVPQSFPWGLFITGELVLLTAIFLLHHQRRSS